MSKIGILWNDPARPRVRASTPCREQAPPPTSKTQKRRPPRPPKIPGGRLQKFQHSKIEHMATWRQYFRPYIQKIILENREKEEKEIRRVLRENKPPDARSYRSVNAVWLSEVRKQLGVFFPKAPRPGVLARPGKEFPTQTTLNFD